MFIVLYGPECDVPGLPLPELTWWPKKASIKQNTELANGHQEPAVVIKQENQNSFNASHTVWV